MSSFFPQIHHVVVQLIIYLSYLYVIVQSCFVSANCRKDSVSCFSRLQDQIESRWLDFLHGIRAGIFWAASLQRISEYFGVKFSKNIEYLDSLRKYTQMEKKKISRIGAQMREISSI